MQWTWHFNLSRFNMSLFRWQCNILSIELTRRSEDATSKGDRGKSCRLRSVWALTKLVGFGKRLIMPAVNGIISNLVKRAVSCFKAFV